MASKLADELCAEVRHQCEQAEHFKGLWMQANDEIEQLRARIAELESQREGWVLVPKEPTEEMMKAFNGLPYSWATVTFATKYKAMLSAAPKKENDK